MRKLDILIPVFNEEEVLPEFYERLRGVLSNLELEGWDAQAIFIDDGSTDDSVVMLEKYQEEGMGVVRLIRTARNYGHQAAIWAGLKNSRSGVCVVAIDSDLQDPPELIVEMVGYLSDYDVCLTRRIYRADRFWKIANADFFYKVVEFLTEGLLRRQVGDFWALGEAAVNRLKNNYGERHIFLRGMVQDLGLEVRVIDYQRGPRVGGGSTKYSFARMINLAVAGVAGFTIRPLVYISYIAFFSAGIAGVAILFFVLGHFFGFVTFAPGVGLGITVLLLLTVATHLSLAVMSIYIAKISIEAVRRPVVALRESE